MITDQITNRNFGRQLVYQLCSIVLLEADLKEIDGAFRTLHFDLKLI